MIRQKIYLDTSVINFLFADDSPEKKEATQELFDNFIKTSIYEAFISDFVIEEINNTTDPEKRKLLVNVIEKYPIEFAPLNRMNDIQDLAASIIKEGIIPKKKFLDALHIATSVVNKFDYLVSWNYKHLANVTRERKVLALNYNLGYLHPIRIITPLDLIDYGN